MSEPQASGMSPEAQAPDGGAACGAMLRKAREAAGLSIDAIAQQLKLAPRQVQALEDGQFELLPGRTFVRGFLRNYARALHLDPEKVLASLPEPAKGETPLPPTSGNMGEIRVETTQGRNWTRWAIPLALIALVALAAVYEYLRRDPEVPGMTETRPVPMPGRTPPAAPATTTTAPLAPSEPAGRPLPNPLAGGDSEAAKSASEPALASGAPAPAAETAAAAGTVVSTAIPPLRPGEPTLVIVFGGTSWTEVKDRSGKVLLSVTGSPGMTQSVTGTPPFDIIVGSVANVSMTFRGAPVDLTPYARANVARLRLP